MIDTSKMPFNLYYYKPKPSNTLPFYLGDEGTGDGDGSGGDGGGEPKERPELTKFALCYQANTSKPKNISRCSAAYTSKTNKYIGNADIKTSNVKKLNKCINIQQTLLNIITNCYSSSTSKVEILQICNTLLTEKPKSIDACNYVTTSNINELSKCIKLDVQKTIDIKHCDSVNVYAQSIVNCLKTNTDSVDVVSCSLVEVQPAVPVPCRFYPYPIPEPEIPASACRLRPPSSELPLYMSSKQIETPSSRLPFTMTCWHDVPVKQIPTKDTYIVITIIKADIDGVIIEPLSFKISTDMNAFCWSGDVEISPDDYEKIKDKLGGEVGSEPIINVYINNEKYSIVAESSNENLSFEQQTHTISGRSRLARMGSDYVTAKDDMFGEDNYASQIVNQQLANSGFTVDFEVDDWLIPANSYSASNKTPLAVIADIADAAGGYIESHKHESKLSIKKKWKINAWNLSTATADITYQNDVISTVSGTPVQTPRYNIVRLMSDKVAHGVHRQLGGKDRHAPTENNQLFTDQIVTVAKGSAILSESGKHSIYPFKLPISDEIPLAELGEIRQQTDKEGSWNGITTGISISVQLVNDVTEAWQTATVNRYLDK